MNDEEYNLAKNDYITFVKKYVIDNGGLFPHITIFANIKNPTNDEENKLAIINIPIPDEFMVNDDARNKFVDLVIPDLFKSINKKFIPHGLCWASEAWMRTANKDFDLSTEDWKALPIKKEIIMICIESDRQSESIIYEIKRKGKQVNADGNLVDVISLEQQFENETPPKTEGRFAGLFKKLKN